MIPTILYIETSGDICSVCIAEGTTILGIKESDIKNSHSSLAPVFIKNLFTELHIPPTTLHAVCVSKGPGSYTGLRIGAALAKSICYAFDIPLVAVSSLLAMAYGASEQFPGFDYYCPMIDARRLEVYTSIYDRMLRNVLPDAPLILDDASLAGFTTNNTLFFGNGGKKFQEIKSEIKFQEHFKSSAAHLVNPCLALFSANSLENITYFEPNYIKPFWTVQKK